MRSSKNKDRKKNELSRWHENLTITYMNKFWLYYSSILLAIILSTIVLYFARPVFMPLALAGILSLVFMRPCGWLERIGLPRVVTAVLSGLFLLSIVAA